MSTAQNTEDKHVATAAERQLLADIVENGGTLSYAGGEGMFRFTVLRGDRPSKAYCENRFVDRDTADRLYDKGLVRLTRRGRSIQLVVTDLGTKESQ